jgi:hypothetical protein
MDFELKAIIPAICIIVGWGLNELSQWFKGKREARRVINRSLYSLIDLLLILNYKKSLLKSALKPDKLMDAHLVILDSLFEDKRFNSDDFKNKLFQTIGDLAEIDPILCQGLRINAEAVKIFGKIDNTDRDDIRFQYEALEVFIKQLEMLVRKVSNKHSIIMRMRYEIFKQQNLSDDKTSMDSLFQGMK